MEARSQHPCQLFCWGSLLFGPVDDAQRSFFFPKREQPFLKVLGVGEVVVKGPFGHPKSIGQGLDGERFGSGLFKQGESFLQPSASAELRHDLFLLCSTCFSSSEHTIWYGMLSRGERSVHFR